MHSTFQPGWPHYEILRILDSKKNGKPKKSEYEGRKLQLSDFISDILPENIKLLNIDFPTILHWRRQISGIAWNFCLVVPQNKFLSGCAESRFSLGTTAEVCEKLTNIKNTSFAEKIRVGKDYQVFVPELKGKMETYPDSYPDKALLVWAPAREISESNLEEYVCLARERYAYNSEQALGMLFWHKHDMERAIIDLANFTPFPDEWSKEDKVLFEQAFQFHGKSFTRIRQMVNMRIKWWFDKIINFLVF